jgi:hypothetical protein
MENEQTEPKSAVATVVEALIARVIELEQRQIDLERRYVEHAGELRQLFELAKLNQDAIEASHAGNKKAFAQVADSLERLALQRSPDSGPSGVN